MMPHSFGDSFALILVPAAMVAFLCLSVFMPRRPGLWIAAFCCGAYASFWLHRVGLFWSTSGYQMATLFSFFGMLNSVLANRVSKPAPVANAQSGGSQNDSHPDPAAPILPAVRPKHGFSAVAGMAELKGRLLEAATEAIKKGSSQTRNGILLYGGPGNGKTFILEALAHELKVPIIALNHSDVASKWLGNTPRWIADVFRQAQRKAPCVLFLDECDAFLEDRRNSGDGSGAQENRRTVEVFLKQLVAIRGTGVVVVAATNLLDALDPAVCREGRFDFKIEVPNPDGPARLALLQAGLAKHLTKVRVAPEVVQSLAKRWTGFSVKRLMAVAEQAGIYAKRHQRTELSRDDFMAILREVQGVAGRPPENTKTLDQLVLGRAQRDTLAGLAMRLQRAFEFEEAGGSIPTGLLFYGPPGTGKTETARALAKASNYAFISTSGNDLIRDGRLMDKIYQDALNARPAIIFVDEADDLLASREGAPYRSMTNKFLTLMDGAGGRVPDLLYIAATNHPDQLDSAALRGGRFTEKVEFCVPDQHSLAPWLAQWFATKGWACELEFDELALSLEGHSMANIQEVLQQAVNAALQRTGDFSARMLTEGDLKKGIATVLG